jgi:hypothetical protein
MHAERTSSQAVEPFWLSAHPRSTDTVVAPLMGVDLERYLAVAAVAELRQYVRDLVDEINAYQHKFVPQDKILENPGFELDETDLANMAQAGLAVA